MPRSIRSERLGVLRAGITVAHLPQARRATVLRLTTALLLLALLSKHPNHIVKRLFDIDAVLGRRLDKLTAQILGQRLPLLGRNGALHGLVALVADQHDGHGQRRARGGADGRGQVTCARGRAGIGGLLDHFDLVVEFLYPRERGAGSDAVDKNETLTVADPLVAQSGVFFLAGRIEDFQHARLLIDDDLLAVGVFNGWVVGFDEVIEAELFISIHFFFLIRSGEEEILE